MKCPKCGFANPSGQNECRRCGVIFSRIKKPRKRSDKTVFKAAIPCQPPFGVLRKLILPLAVAKRFVHHIYDQILQILWSELSRDKTGYTTASNLIAVGFFSLFSVVLYYFRDYDTLILMALLAIWAIDYYTAKRGYKKAASVENIRLTKREDDRIDWDRIGPTGAIDHDVFDANGIKEIRIDQEFYRGGAFMEEIDDRWRMLLISTDGLHCLAYAHGDIKKVLSQAVRLSKKIKAPVKISNGEGKSAFIDHQWEDPYEFRFKRRKLLARERVGVRREPNGTVIHSKWTGENIRHFILTVLSRSGFLLFLLILTELMMPFGKIVYHGVLQQIGNAPPSLHLDISLSGILGVFWPQWHWMDYGELIVAIGPLVYSGRYLKRRKSLLIDSEKIRFHLDGDLITDIPTDDAHYPVFVNDLWPCLLIVGKRDVVVVENLQSEADYRAMMYAVEDAIDRARDSKKDGTSEDDSLPQGASDWPEEG